MLRETLNVLFPDSMKPCTKPNPYAALPSNLRPSSRRLLRKHLPGLPPFGTLLASAVWLSYSMLFHLCPSFPCGGFRETNTKSYASTRLAVFLLLVLASVYVNANAKKLNVVCRLQAWSLCHRRRVTSPIFSF